MSAQVDLLQSAPTRKGAAGLFTLGQVALLTLLTYGVMLGIAGWSWWQINAMQQESAAVGAEIKQIKDQAEELRKNAARSDPQLLAQIEQTQQAIRARDEIARTLEASTSSTREGFSEYLRGLARQIPEGLWLTAILLADNGSQIEIRGSLIDTAALPEYIHRLRHERTFRGRNFSTLTLNRVTAARPQAPSSIALAARTGVATPDLQEKLTTKPGAFVGVIPQTTPSGELANVMDFVLVPQRTGDGGRETKP